LNIGDLNEARQALKAVPNILLARRNFLRARLYLAEGNTQLALQEIAGIHPGKRDRAELYVVGGIIAFQMGDMERAQRLLKAAIEEDPSRSEAWWKLGSIARHKGELPSAQQLFERAVSLDPYAVEIRLEFGNLLLKLGAIAEAGRQFDEVLALDAENVTALAGRARVAAESDSHDPLGHIEAVRSKGYPTLASLLTARYHMTRGEWQQASQELSHLLAVPLVDRNEVVVWLAISLRQEGKLAQAISTLESVLRQDWNNPEAHISLSEVNVWQGKMEEAKLHAIVAQDLLAKKLQTPALKDRLSLLLARCQQNSASLRRTLQELSNKIEITSGPTTPNLELKLLYTFLKQETSSKSPLAMADGSKK
jgi:tetratricopeptide (TPR) repeat protein